ncbi:calcineurin B homologous protein 1-like [Symsagittifera roscoffensis]|uniref:calcineurin B homologous protein 1-like n=1 Tax=Symsagittifera roscoffensis TaxID=84072 RepID=UPI00307BCBB5
MGISYSQISSEEMRVYIRDTGFSVPKIQMLKTRFDALDRGFKGYLDRGDFLAIPELVLNPVGDRIIDLFFQQRQDEEHGGMGMGEKLTFRNFLKAIVIFRPVKDKGCGVGNIPSLEESTPNSRRNKLAFAFRMYDLNGDGSITKEEILGVLLMMVGNEVPDEQLTCIAQRAILEVDENADGELSFEEYVKIMERVDVEQKLSIKFLD